MFLISHRGNINGKNVQKENSPDYILKALSFGYDVEIDVWYVNNKFFLGHDTPQYEISIEFLKNDKLWCHAKNLASLEKMLYNNITCFWHQTDDYTLTSKGYIWTYPKWHPVYIDNQIILVVLLAPILPKQLWPAHRLTHYELTHVVVD